MALVIFVLGGLVSGLALRFALYRLTGTRSYDEGSLTSLLDAVLATVLLTIVVWVATSWLLALTHRLSAQSLTAAGVAELAAGTGTLVRLRAFRSRDFELRDRWATGAAVLALAPVVLWTAFVAWRGTILPVYNHDALAYHLPKAVLLMKAHGIRIFDVPEARIATWPINYELLLSDTLLLTGSDHYTAAVGTLSYVTLTLFAARIAASWWGAGTHVGVVAALTASAPIVLLHSGLHKNDLLMSVFTTAALVWAARWFAMGCTASLLLATAALLLGIGTKITGAFLLVAVAPMLVAGAIRRKPQISRRRVLTFVFGASCGSLLLGSATYAINLWVIHKVVAPPDIGGGYGDWSNLWTYTYLVIAAPFGNGNTVWNPFRHAYWWWPSNDVWMSHFGVVFSVLAVLLVPCIVRYRSSGQASVRVERASASLSALGMFSLTLPIHGMPIGYFASFGRYLVFALPFVAAWTVSPLTIQVERASGRLAPLVKVALALATVAWTSVAVNRFGVHDAYAPIEFVEHVVDHPEDRLPWVRRNRAASIFDGVAGPDESCVFDVGFDTWIYPAYGARWTRAVGFLEPSRGEVRIPDDANWVIVDRSWNVFFGHPDFVDMGKAGLLGKGKPTNDDLRVSRQLRKDARFELVYEDAAQNQALFRRKRSSGSLH